MLLQCTIQIPVFRSTVCSGILLFRSGRVSKYQDSAASGPLDRQRNLATISQIYRLMGSNPPNCSGKCASWYSIFGIADSRSIGCRLGDLTDSRRVESKSSYFENRRREIQVFRKRVRTNQRDRSEKANYFATRSRFLIAVYHPRRLAVIGFLSVDTLVSVR